jgi:hypothetical protein
MGEKSAPEVTAQIANLRTLSRQQLLELWVTVYRRTAPQGIRRELLVPFLAYRIQENAYGGLKPTALGELRRIARTLEKNRASNELLGRPRIKTGTRLFREWRGHTHEVVVTESGYEYRRVSYQSLSEVARKITGTRWSGPAFFGLKKANPIPGHRNE